MIAQGLVLGARSELVSASIPGARIGQFVEVSTAAEAIPGRICAVDGARAVVAVFGAGAGIARGARVRTQPFAGTCRLGTCALGRALDARGRPLDGGPIPQGLRVALAQTPPAPNERVAVTVPFWTGVRAIDALLALGRGARVGIFGAPGAGKTVLLEAIVRGSRCDAVVVGLIGERGREARRWIDARIPHATIVCATSDRPAAERVRAAALACAQAASLRERGLHVLLVLDSLARIAAASREVAVAAGESVGRGGYPPSVFADLARLVEIAGETTAGSMTMIASVLSDGDERDPVSDAARSLLDGHIVLSAQLAAAGRFPAIDATASSSRTMEHVASAGHRRAAAAVRRALALLDRIDDARRIGIEPADSYAQSVLACEDALERLLRQDGVSSDPATTLAALAGVAASLE